MAIVASSAGSVPTGSRALEPWQAALREAVRDPLALCRMLRLPAGYEAAAVRAARQFPLLAPLDYISRIRPGDPHDPLLRQILPLDEETQPVPEFSRDPVGDLPAAQQPGLLQKYHGRVLLLAARSCAVHCRYCFRRHYPYGQAPHSARQWAPALRAIAADPDIEEVVLSGGDPWMLNDARLRQLVQRLQRIEHVRTLRMHTRLPIVIPSRVTDALLDLLRGATLAVCVVVHVNHPAELSDGVRAALRKLSRTTAPVLNQSVLLRGVNDDLDVLLDLSRGLIACGVTPYYLHQLDRVEGAAHFETPIARGKQLIEQMRARLPGYAVPRYVQERPGATSKCVIS